MKKTSTLAILGAGKLGIVLAQLALKAGYTVYISGSGDPAKIALSIKILAPGAKAAASSDAIDHADIIILALPLGKYRSIPVEKLDGKLVIDAMNYWWEVDGKNSEFNNPETSSSEIVADFLDNARVVKALSHMGYHHLLDEAQPVGSTDRKAIAIAGNDTLDNQIVSNLVNDLGFDPVVIGPLSRGKILEPGHELFGANIGKDELLRIISNT
jgi:predicted dinucleotide-binding enzyme